MFPFCADSEGQENDHRLTLLPTRPSCQVFIPVPNSNEAAPSTCDLSPLSPTRDPPQPVASNIRKTSSDSDLSVSGFTCSGQFGCTTMAEVASEQVENDDPCSTLILAPFQQRSGCLGNGRRISSDPEVCELFRESDVRFTTTMRCGERAKMAGFQRWQKVEGQRSGPSLLSKTFSSEFSRYRGQLRDLNVIQRPSLDFDKMQVSLLGLHTQKLMFL